MILFLRSGLVDVWPLYNFVLLGWCRNRSFQNCLRYRNLEHVVGPDAAGMERYSDRPNNSNRTDGTFFFCREPARHDEPRLPVKFDSVDKCEAWTLCVAN